MKIICTVFRKLKKITTDNFEIVFSLYYGFHQCGEKELRFLK